jgi:hypothetical protein
MRPASNPKWPSPCKPPCSPLTCLQQLSHKQSGQPALEQPSPHERVALHYSPRRCECERCRQLCGGLSQDSCQQGIRTQVSVRTPASREPGVGHVSARVARERQDGCQLWHWPLIRAALSRWRCVPKSMAMLRCTMANPGVCAFVRPIPAAQRRQQLGRVSGR